MNDDNSSQTNEGAFNLAKSTKATNAVVADVRVKGRDADDAPRHLSKQEFGQRLKRKMIEKGMHHAELARRSDLPRNNISTYINGRSYPSEQSLLKLAKALEISADELLPNRLEMAIRGEQMPDFQIKSSISDPNRSWLTINRLVLTTTALKIAQLLQEDQALNN